MKSKVPIIFAIIILIVAFFAIQSYVNKVEAKAKDQLKGDLVLAALADVKKGGELTEKVVGVKSVPKQFMPAQAIQRAERGQIFGRRTRVPLKAGDLILWSDLATEATDGISIGIPADQRAYTATITKGIKAGLIAVSDHVDILGSFSVPKTPQLAQMTTSSWRVSPDMVNVVLLQNVTVLAVGEVTSGMNRAEGNSGDLTMALTLPEAQLLMFAAQHGELGVVLRRQGTIDVLPREDLKRITFDSIEQIIGDLDGRRSLRMVGVQKGTKTEAVPVNSAEILDK